MTTIVGTFYNQAVTKDFVASGEVSIKKLGETVPATDNSTVAAHPSSASTTSITLYPLASNSVQSNNSINAGWAINLTGADGMSATAESLRVIAAGTWSVHTNLNIPIGGTGVGSLSVTITAYVYRVLADLSRSLLGSAVSGSAASTALATFSGTVISNISLPEVLLQAGESIHIGYVSTCVQSAGLVGATVAANIVVTLNSTMMITLPSPGIRTRFPRAAGESLSVPDTLARTYLSVRALGDTSTVTEAITRTATYGRTINTTVPTADSLAAAYQGKRSISDNAPSSDSLVRLFVANRSLSDTAVINEAMTRQYIGNRTLADVVPTAEAISRRMVFARTVLESLSAGSGTTVINYRPILLFED